ncbi:hypothetical protein D3C81_2274980 [compost metagenome]
MLRQVEGQPSFLADGSALAGASLERATSWPWPLTAVAWLVPCGAMFCAWALRPLRLARAVSSMLTR